MKRIFILLLMFNIFLVSACAPRITYTKEFPYLPAYNNMTLDTTEEDQEEKDSETKPGELIKKTYIIENADVENVLEEYEKILQEDGWTTTYDGKPQMLEIKKDEHQGMLVAYDQDGVVKLDVTAK